MGLAITKGENALAIAVAENGERFTIQEGLSADLVHQLRERSLDRSDTELAKTSDYERFGKGSFDDWYASKERTLYALISDTGMLAALAWFGPKPLGRKSAKHLSEQERSEDERTMDSGGWHTIVYRSYPPFRGKGLMTDFVRFAMEEYIRVHPGIRLWSGIFAHNPASMGLAKKLGFVVSEEHSNEGGETILVKE